MNKPPLTPLPLLLFTIAFSLSMLVLQQVQPFLLYNREAILAGEAWRLWSGNIVHTNHYHLFLNLAGLWVFVLLCGSVISTKLLISSIFICSTAIGAGLFIFNPELYWYAGLSGVLYGLFVIGAMCLARAGEIFSFIALLAMVLIKFGSVWLGETDVTTETMIGASIIEEAHIYGVLGGGLIVAYCLCHHLLCHYLHRKNGSD